MSHNLVMALMIAILILGVAYITNSAAWALSHITHRVHHGSRLMYLVDWISVVIFPIMAGLLLVLAMTVLKEAVR